jgi:lipid-A-disaccharide synthase-like uncharacterized protein
VSIAGPDLWFERRAARVHAPRMNQEILHAYNFVLTPMKLVGFLGMALFSGRWLVQFYASKKTGRPTVPRMFWYMSLAGTACLLSYFTFGKRDSVGFLSNLFPASVAAYNLYLDITHQRRTAVS